MNDIPKHLADKVDRRWTMRLARDAASWRRETGNSAAGTQVVDRAGRTIPVLFKRTALRNSPGKPIPPIA